MSENGFAIIGTVFIIIFVALGFGLGYLKFSEPLPKKCLIIIDGKTYKSETYPYFKNLYQTVKFKTNNTTVVIPVEKELIIKL